MWTKKPELHKCLRCPVFSTKTVGGVSLPMGRGSRRRPTSWWRRWSRRTASCRGRSSSSSDPASLSRLSSARPFFTVFVGPFCAQVQNKKGWKVVPPFHEILTLAELLVKFLRTKRLIINLRLILHVFFAPTKAVVAILSSECFWHLRRMWRRNSFVFY